MKREFLFGVGSFLVVAVFGGLSLILQQQDIIAGAVAVFICAPVEHTDP